MQTPPGKTGKIELRATDAVVGIWRNPSFLAFWLGQLASSLGDAIAAVALPLLVLQTTGSVVKMGLMTATTSVGIVITSLTFGVIADRLDPRRVMIACDLARALLWFGVYLAWTFLGPSLALLYVAALAAACLGSAYQVVCVVAIPGLVARDQVTETNGALQGTMALTALAGPVLAGLVSQAFGPITAVAVNALSFLLSMFSLGFVRLRGRNMLPDEIPRLSRLSDFVEGARFLFRHPVLRAMTIAWSLIALFTSGYLDIAVYYVRETLHQTDRDVGVLFSLAAFGGIGGGLSAASIRKRLGFAPAVLGAWVLFGLSLVFGGGLGSFVAMCGFGVTLGFADVLSGVLETSAQQELTPDAVRGRVTGTYWGLAHLPVPLGATLTTLLAAHVGAAHALVIIGIAFISIAVGAAFSPIRTGTRGAALTAERVS